MKDVSRLLSLKGKKKNLKNILLRLKRRSQGGKHVGVQTNARAVDQALLHLLQLHTVV